MVEAAVFRAGHARPRPRRCCPCGWRRGGVGDDDGGGGKALVGHLKVHAILSQRPFTQYCMNLKMAGHFARGAAPQPPHHNIVCSIARARNEEGRKKNMDFTLQLCR